MYLEMRLLKRQSGGKEVIRWALMQSDSPKRKSGHTDITEVWMCVGMTVEGGSKRVPIYESRREALRETNPAGPYLGTVSRTVRK